MKISSISLSGTNGLIQLDFSASGQVATDITASGTFGVVSHSVESGGSSYGATYVVS
jgi:hypothetical protein